MSGKYAKQDVLNKSNELYIPLQEHDRIAVAVVELDPRPRMRPGFNGEMSSQPQFTMQCLAKELLSHPSLDHVGFREYVADGVDRGGKSRRQ